MIRERERSAFSGWLVLPVLLALAAGTLRFLFLALQAHDIVAVLVAVFVGVATVTCFGGFFVVNPNEGRVLQLFGAYKGTVRTPGLRWASPFYSKQHVSLRVRNFESGKLKVNDFDGNPVEIAAVVVWRVVDTAEAVFEVDKLRELREGADRERHPQPRDPVPVRHA
jgi:regulator of protease activity HflC (stomatin/prohibitin superfamily)